MKISNRRSIFYGAVSFVLVSFIAQGAQSNDKKIDAKCYVELADGTKAISFWAIPAKNLTSLAKAIQGEKVLAPSSNSKHVRVSKTHECALLDNRFISAAANSLDRKTPR